MSSPAGLFITATGTGVGKTAITAGLARSLRYAGLPVRVMKPLETGADPEPGDARLLIAASGMALPLDLVCPVRLPAPLSPWQAAIEAGVELDLDLIWSSFELLAQRGPVLVEGAGGLLAPIRRRYFMADLARDLALPLLVVVDPYLGALNHTLLTLHEAQRRGLAVAGIVVNHASPENDDDPAIRTNGHALRELLADLDPPVPVLAEVGFCPGFASEEMRLAAIGTSVEASGLTEWARQFLSGNSSDHF